MIALHIKNTTAVNAHQHMQPDAEGNKSAMARSLHWHGSRPVRKGNAELRILADARDIPDDIPGLIDVYTLEQVLGYRTPDLDENGEKQRDAEGNVLMRDVAPEPAARAVYDALYDRTPYEIDSVIITPPLLFAEIAGQSTAHLLM